MCFKQRLDSFLFNCLLRDADEMCWRLPLFRPRCYSLVLLVHRSSRSAAKQKQHIQLMNRPVSDELHHVCTRRGTCVDSGEEQDLQQTRGGISKCFSLCADTFVFDCIVRTFPSVHGGRGTEIWVCGMLKDLSGSEDQFT